MRTIPIKTVVLAGALVALASVTASATTITPSFSGFVPGISITYTATLSSGEVRDGDGFTIYDMYGYTGFISVPAGWVASAALVGSPFDPPATPAGVDDPGLFNMTFTYNGGTNIRTTGQVGLGTFVISTTATSLGLDDWVSMDHKLDGTRSTTGHTDQITVASVPESGSTLAFLGLSLMVVGLLSRRALV